jgi:hypothetical protein
MRAEISDFITHWSVRAHTALESQLRRKKMRRQLQDPKKKCNCPCGGGKQNGATNSPAAGQQPPKSQKREWWRLDPNVTDKYRPVEPPATPDPGIVPTRDRFVFGWEAPMSPLEEVLQDDVRRLLPNVHKWIVRRAIERAGLKSENDRRPPLPLPDDLPPVAEDHPKNTTAEQENPQNRAEQEDHQ